MKKALQVILHILGFPALIALVVLVNLPIIKGGMSYGIFVFVGVIVAVVMAIIYYIAFLCVVKSKKKSITKQTITLILVIFFCLCGLWVVADVALPDFLASATSNTIFYEDLVDNYQARALVNEALLDEYILRNYNNGNLPNEKNGGLTLKQYQEEGVRNEKVKQLLTIHFASIDKDGYKSFVEPWIGMANGGRLTIPTLVHLLLDERELQNVDYYLYDEALKEVQTDPVMWNVLDMLGKPMDIAMDIEGMLAGMEGMEGIAGLVPVIFGAIQGPAADITESLLGSPIYVTYADKTITLTPSNESRGVLDYQSMAWLDSNGLLYAVVTLISVRNIFLIFAIWIILLNFAIGMLRGMGKEHKKVKYDEKGGSAPAYRGNAAGYPYPYPYGFVQIQGNDYGYLDMNRIRKNLIQGSQNGRMD